MLRSELAHGGFGIGEVGEQSEVVIFPVNFNDSLPFFCGLAPGDASYPGRIITGHPPVFPVYQLWPYP
jgi:hypothetical protein